MLKFRAEYDDCIYSIINMDFKKEEAIGELSGLNFGGSEIQYFSFNELEISLDDGLSWESFKEFNKSKEIERIKND